jgi:hypothetical protein
MEVVMDIMKHIGFMGLGVLLVGSLIGAPAFAEDKHDKHMAGGSKVMITSPKDGDKVGDNFELKYQRGFKGTLKGLSKGEHQITVKAANEDHASVAATHTITVDVQ